MLSIKFKKNIFIIIIFFFFSLKDFDKKAAKVGVTECSKEPTPYDHPDNPNIKFWDLPGMGTKNFPMDTYCDQVEIDKYHAFLIFTDTRFRENHFKLAEKISSIDKKFSSFAPKLMKMSEPRSGQSPQDHSTKKPCLRKSEQTVQKTWVT